jgi:hypothetical protein
MATTSNNGKVLGTLAGVLESAFCGKEAKAVILAEPLRPGHDAPHEG